MNFKMTILALIAVLGFGAATIASAQAMSIPTTPPTQPGCTSDCGGGDDGDNGEIYDPFCMFAPCKDTPEVAEEGCMKNCGGPVEEGCMINCAPGGGFPGGDIPGNKAGLQLCDAQIGDLKKVSAKQVRSITGRDDVQVVPVCAEKNLIEQQQGVENLRTAVANNDKMDAALDQTGYTADDVVGLVVGRTQAVLYVHS